MFWLNRRGEERLMKSVIHVDVCVGLDFLYHETTVSKFTCACKVIWYWRGKKNLNCKRKSDFCCDSRYIENWDSAWSFVCLGNCLGFFFAILIRQKKALKNNELIWYVVMWSWETFGVLNDWRFACIKTYKLQSTRKNAQTDLLTTFAENCWILRNFFAIVAPKNARYCCFFCFFVFSNKFGVYFLRENYTNWRNCNWNGFDVCC